MSVYFYFTFSSLYSKKNTQGFVLLQGAIEKAPYEEGRRGNFKFNFKT